MRPMRNTQAIRGSKAPTARGFTLIELLVVIGIFVVLAAMAFPFATGVKEGNNMMGCQANLRGIDRATKLFHLDTGKYPRPVSTICHACSTTTPNAVEECPSCGETDDLEYVGGLHDLVEGGYLKQQCLACPASPYDREQPQHYISYEGEDPDADKGGGAFKYLPNRTTWSAASGLSTTDTINGRDVPIYFRQLAPDPTATAPWDGNSIEWHADESTVVTWCNYHAGLIRRNGEDQYLVLFLDGQAQLHSLDSLAGSDAAIDETWRVTPLLTP